MDYTSHYDSPLGGMTMASDGTALVGLWFDGQRFFAETLAQEHCERHDLEVFTATRRWLDTYFSGKPPLSVPSLLMRGSAFRQAVWEQMLAIPFGETMTYGDLARRIAARRGLGAMSARAVGGAVRRNPISLIIPCHRVIGANGLLTGYAGGVEKKQRLLQMEREYTSFARRNDGQAMKIPK